MTRPSSGRTPSGGIETASFKRLALTAAPIFLEHGFAAVSVRMLAERMGIKGASLYHHCPGGKAELYARSLAVFLEEYRSGLRAAAGRARFPNGLFRMAEWIVVQPPVDISRVLRVDLPHLEQDVASALIGRLHGAVLAPLVSTLKEAQELGKLRTDIDTELAAASVVSLVDGLGFSHLPTDRKPTPAEVSAAQRTVRAGLKLLCDGMAT